MNLSQCYGRICGEVLVRSLLYGVPFRVVFPLPLILCAAITIKYFTTSTR